MKACPVPLLLMLLTTLLASCLLVPTSTAFAPPPASFFGPASCSGSRRCLSSFSRPLSGDSSSSSSRNSSGRSSRSSSRVGRSSSSGDFSFGDLERELARRRAEERRAEEARAEQEREEAAAEVEAAAAASRFSGLEEGDSFMEEQMTLRKTLLKAFVLVYNQGQPEEGVYTLFVQGRNVLRAWQDKPEAARYALMLRAEDLPLGKPTELPMSQIIGFCKDNGVGLELVRSGRGLQPPSRNKPEFDFDCSSGQDSSSTSRRPGEARGREDSLFTPQELARIKKQFEQSLEGGEEE